MSPLFVSRPAAFDRASHANVFATLLDLMGVPEAARVRRYWPSLLARDGFEVRPRAYFMGDQITGDNPFGGLVPFDREGTPSPPSRLSAGKESGNP